MKKFIALLLVALSALLFAGCKAQTNDLKSGEYFAVGDYDEFLTPYICLVTDKNEFSFGAGAVVSYVEHGSYKIKDGVIIATSQSKTFKFEIKDSKTLVLLEIGDYDPFGIPSGTQFVFSESLK